MDVSNLYIFMAKRAQCYFSNINLILSLPFLLCYCIYNLSDYLVFQGYQLSLLCLLIKYAWVSCNFFVSSFLDDVFCVLLVFIIVSCHSPSGFYCNQHCRKASAASMNYHVLDANHHQGCTGFWPVFH